ncbi:MAG TPA: hypothetical protein PKE66_11555, partial [Pyrinomonadaceae bacterium]|nr:hypothetical protein [Pyrinomonadaceae bacterium]
MFVSGQTVAPGAPGKDAQWATAAKQGVGTSATTQSKVWFTLAQGVMTEVYYPDVTVANVHLLQFIVVNPKTKKVETEQDDAFHQIRVTRPDSLTFQQINTAKSEEWKITKTYVTDPESDTVLIEVGFDAKRPDLNLYVYFDPSLGNSGMGDSASSVFYSDCGPCPAQILRATDASSGIFTHLYFTSQMVEIHSGYLGDDALNQLREHGKIVRPSNKAVGGNIVQVAKIADPRKFTAFLSLGPRGRGAKPFNAFTPDFPTTETAYEQGWADYVKTLPRVDAKYQA